MTKTAEKAARAARLRADEALQEFWKDTLDAQSDVFLSPTSTPEQREEAHAIVRALDRLGNQMDGAILDHKLEEKGQHRASD